MKYTHLVWDFNGTILNDVEIGMDAANTLLARRGLPIMESIDRYKELFGFPIINYYIKAGFDFEKESFDDVAVEWVKEYMFRLPRAGVYPEVEDTLRKARELDVSQILLSATELDMLRGQVKDLGILPLFDEIYGLDNIHASSKKVLAQELRRKYPEGHFLFVGDTDHDLEVAQAAGADCILFDGGHQSRQHLSTLGCPMISSASEILHFL